MKIAYNHLSQHIIENTTIEQISDRLFQLGHEHEIDGNIFNMELTPNRGDCLSLNGILRDLAVFYRIDFNQNIYAEELDHLEIDFENLSKNTCPKISFLKLEIDQIPNLYRGSLGNYFKDLSLNKNNFFTDISNYLSYETGQPTHCYDADTIKGSLLLKEVNESKEFETLLDKKIKLTGNNTAFLLNNEIINLAGVVGSKSTSCSVDTKTVIVECAFFQPEAIIGKSVRYDIQSEASHKFERGVDPECQERVLRRFITLVNEHTNIKSSSFVSYNYIDNPVYKIPVNVQKINHIIGIDLSESEYLNYLVKLGFIVEGRVIKVPSFRSDVRTQNDLAEEVARIIGYDNIPKLDINIPKSEKLSYEDIELRLRYFLLDNGFYEVVNSPFVSSTSSQAIKVTNPLDTNREFLRTNITDSLVDNLLFNERRQKDSIKLFEISDVYSLNNAIHRKRKLSIIASGRVGLNYEDFSKKINKKYLKNLLIRVIPESAFNISEISRSSLETKIKNEIVSVEVDLDMFTDDILSYSHLSKSPSEFKQYSPISEQPSSFKDISYLINDFTKVSELEGLLLNFKSNIVKHSFVFDYYKNEKKQEIKIGFRFILQSKKATLTSAEIESVYDDIIKSSLEIEGVEIPGI